MNNGSNIIDLDRVNLESWFEELEAESLMNSGASVDTAAINPNNLSQAFMPTLNEGTDLGGGSSNTPQYEIPQEIMPVSSTPTGNATTIRNDGIISSAVNFISNICAQSPQTEFPQIHAIQSAQEPQYDTMPVFRGKDVQHPATYSLPNTTFGYQMPSNQLAMPMFNAQTVSSGNLNVSAPVGFAASSQQYFSYTAYHQYILQQIWRLKCRYSNELVEMHRNAMKSRTQATSVEEYHKYRNDIIYLERMMAFLDISRVELLPNNYQMICDTMNDIVNYMSLHTDKPGASEQHEPAHQPSTVNPIPPQTSLSSLNFDVNSVLSPQSISGSPFLLSSHSSAPSKAPSKEPEASNDQAFNLVNSVEYDPQPLPKRRRQLSVPSQKRAGIEEEIKEINAELRVTSINVVTDSSEDEFGAHEGTKVRCLFRHVCSLLGPQTSEKMPEFVLLLLVPDNYPASSPRIIRPSCNELNNEPWRKLYDDMLAKFNLSLFGIAGIPSLRDMARHWDASARAIVTDFLEKRGGKRFSNRYGSWDSSSSSKQS